jgi:signal transduction histidine kinase
LRLADFILRDMEGILADWEAFAAAQVPAAANMESLALRDHAQQILEAVVQDIKTPQTRDQQLQKSLGRAPQTAGAAQTAAQTHAHLRARSGFEIVQMAGEYRALRTSVLRRWADACAPADTDLQDMIRFNEAIDQAIVESVAAFTLLADQARNFFLGMLGHDMRGPLSTVQLSAGYIAKRNAGEDVSKAASRIVRSGKRMQALLDDLVDFNRVRFGLGINVFPSEIDLADEVADELQQLRVAHPGTSIALEVHGDVRGVWDANRLDQVLGNLVSNAVRYGDPGAPVRVVLTGRDSEVTLAVKNRGPMIEPSYLAQIFDPLKRGPAHRAGSGREGNLGLGLYISREIAIAHGGTIDAQSNETETVFTVHLPRIAAGQ